MKLDMELIEQKVNTTRIKWWTFKAKDKVYYRAFGQASDIIYLYNDIPSIDDNWILRVYELDYGFIIQKNYGNYYEEVLGLKDYVEDMSKPILEELVMLDLELGYNVSKDLFDLLKWLNKV